MTTPTVFPSHQIPGLNPLAKFDFLRLLLVSALCCLALPVGAATRSWTGDGPSVNGFKFWSDPNNWSPIGVPQNGEDLFIGDSGGDLDMFNDLPDLTIGFLRFNVINTFGIGDANAHLYGVPLGISRGVINTNDFECQVYIHCGVKLTGNATFVTGDTLFNPLFAAEDVAMHIIGRIDLNGHDLVLLAKTGFLSEGRMYIEGGISGTGNVLVTTEAYVVSGDLDHWGRLEFKGAGSDFSGTLTLNSELGSEILLNVPSGVVVKDLLVVNNVGTVKLARPEQIGDNATVRVQDGATLQLNGHNETIQNLELIVDSNDSRPSVLDPGSGTLFLQGNISSICNNSAQTPVIKGKLNLLSGSHDINVSGSVYAGLEMQAQMLGFGNFSKSGNAALLLQASNSFNSSISILRGVLDVRHNHALGDIAGSTAIAGGILTLRNVAIVDELLFALAPGGGGEMPGATVTSIGVSSWAGQVVLNTNLVVIGGDMTFTGLISGPGGLGCFSSGTMRIAGALANTYTGTTLVRCPLVEFNKPYDVKAFSGPLIVGGAAGGPYEARWLNYYQSAGTLLTLYANGFVNLNGITERFGSITFNGGQIDTGPSGMCILGDPFAANPSYLTVNAANTPAIINGFIQPAGGPAWIPVANGPADPDLLINAGIVGAAPQIIKEGPGTMRLTGTGYYVGVTIVNEGVLDVANVAALGSANFGTIVNEAATLRVSTSDILPESFALFGTGVGGTNGVLHVTGSATVTGEVFLNGPSTINVAQSGGLAIDNKIGGTGPLTKSGPGNLYLGGVSGGAGNNNYSGSTIVTAGTLYLSKNQNVLSVPGPLVVGPATAASPATARWVRTGTMTAGGSVTVNANSLLDLNGNNQTLAQLNLNDGGDVQTGAGQLNFAAGGVVTVGTLNSPVVGLLASSSISGKVGLPVLDYLTFNVGGYGPAPLVPDAELVVPATISGGGNLIKNGPGTMLLGGANTFNDSPPNLAGDLLIYGGTVIAASSGALGGTAGWTLVYNGARLALVGNITINNETLYLNSTNTTTLDNPGGHNTWIGPIIQARDSSIGVNLDWSLTVAGTISGTGSLTKRGAGLLRLGGSANNTHSGDTFVDAGTLFLTKFPNVQAVPANLIIGRPEGGTSATVMHVNSDLIWGDVTVNNGGLLNVNGYSEYIGNLTLNGGGDVQTGAGILHLFTSLAVNPGNFADQSVISGRLGLYPGTFQFSVGSGSLGPGVADCLVSAIIGQSSTTVGLQKNGSGVLQLTGNNTYAGDTTLKGGTLWVNGVQPQSPIVLDHGTRLQGTGTVGHITLNGGLTAIAPGNSPGTLTCSNFNASGAGGTLEMELNSFPAGYDQVVARGVVNLNGLTLKASLNFASDLDHEFTLIHNDDTDAVTGTFTGLAQNAKLYVGGELFRINYTGGTGNDVVLSRLPTPAQPVLTIERVLPGSVRLTWATNDPPFGLQSNTNLTMLRWIPTSPPPVIVGTNNVVTNAVVGVHTLYRLVTP